MPIRWFVTTDQTWVHCYIPETKRQSKQWKHSDSPSPKKTKAVQSAGKVMAYVFWNSRGLIMIDYLAKGRTTVEYYSNLLKELERKICEKRPYIKLYQGQCRHLFLRKIQYFRVCAHLTIYETLHKFEPDSIFDPRYCGNHHTTEDGCIMRIKRNLYNAIHLYEVCQDYKRGNALLEDNNWAIVSSVRILQEAGSYPNPVIERLKGKGIRDAIELLRTIGERYLEKNKEVYIVFVDLEKAFDRVDWNKLVHILKKINVDWKDRRLYLSPIGRSSPIASLVPFPFLKPNYSSSNCPSFLEYKRREHITNVNHTYRDINADMEILHIQPKSQKLNTLEQYEIYRHTKIHPNDILNTQLNFKTHRLFDSTLRTHPQRKQEAPRPTTTSSEDRSKHVNKGTPRGANKTTEDMENFQFPGYTSHILEKLRQIASGIVVGVKRNMIPDFKIIKSMGSTDDKMEMINLNVWKASQSFNIYATYNPPNNEVNFGIINVNRKTILIGNFNSLSITWGYNYTTPPGDILEDFISSRHLQLIYNPTDPPTFLHYNGKGTNPDHLFVSSNIFDNTSRKVIEDPGSGHRIINSNFTRRFDLSRENQNSILIRLFPKSSIELIARKHKFINKIENKNIIPKKEPVRYGNRLLTSDEKIANYFATYYSLSRKKTQRLKTHDRTVRRLLAENINQHSNTDNNNTEHQLFNASFTMQELINATNKIKANKSPGPDLIFAEFILHMGHNAKCTLLHLFNFIWNSSVPSQWKKAIIIPILKKNKSPADPENFRPISLTSILAKVMERMIIHRLNWFLESNHIIHPAQAGFRCHRSTDQQVVSFTQHINGTSALTQEDIKKLNKIVHLQWIPSHCGIAGNEAADFLAKKGTTVPLSYSNKLPFHRASTNISSRVRQCFHKSLEDQIKDKHWKDALNSTLPEWSRREAVATFRAAVWLITSTAWVYYPAPTACSVDVQTPWTQTTLRLVQRFHLSALWIDTRRPEKECSSADILSFVMPRSLELKRFPIDSDALKRAVQAVIASPGNKI
ncbi:hypothetical protein ANN_14773 [Periplaneta americana]|uniref:RNase H type-1 domain-containing protein n=1 Tax=Periplaneta americana TaxID=6978 RepID=A0ABQ8SXA7_PERAM|nr:hypothetical protein ANN_14773 [Periplaneta americana]